VVHEARHAGSDCPRHGDYFERNFLVTELA
jgi:hypothetical protein